MQGQVQQAAALHDNVNTQHDNTRGHVSTEVGSLRPLHEKTHGQLGNISKVIDRLGLVPLNPFIEKTDELLRIIDLLFKQNLGNQSMLMDSSPNRIPREEPSTEDSKTIFTDNLLPSDHFLLA